MNEEDRLRELTTCLQLFVAVARTWRHPNSQIDDKLWKCPMAYGPPKPHISVADLRRAEYVLQGEYPPLEYIR